MRAIVQTRYGPPERVLELRDIERPIAGHGEALVRVQAASVHPDVWHVVRGWPFMLRLIGAGLRRPKVQTPGTDVAGVVDSIGPGVNDLNPGDEVFGEIVRRHQWTNGGAYAEYATARAGDLAVKPDAITFEQAAAAPTSGLIALLNLGNKVNRGDRVLVNGAGGGVGLFASQIAKSRGGIVTAVDRTDKQAVLASVGIDAFIDYTVNDFADGSTQYDVIFDVPGNRSFAELRRALVDGGRYIYVGHDSFGQTGGRWISGTIVRFLKLLVTRPFGRPVQVDQSTPETRTGIQILADLMAAGQVTPVVGQALPLEEAVTAIRRMVEGKTAGKIVLTVE